MLRSWLTITPCSVTALAVALVAAGCTSGVEPTSSAPPQATSSASVQPVDGDFSRTSDDTSTTTGATASTVAPTTTTPAPTTPATSTTTGTTTSTTTSTTRSTTTTTTTTLPPATIAAELDLTADSVLLGTSVEGRPIVAERFGRSGDRRVLVIGVIHGDEDAGVAIVDELRARSTAGTGPEGIELWLVESMNPDGQAAQDRQNANDVDLNRNFPFRWGTIGQPGDGQYAGPSAASEPETRAVVAFMTSLRPDLTLWYHQDANLIIPASGRDGRVRARYAELSGLPVAQCCSGGIYTGIAATWARNELSDQDAAAFIVELPGGDLDAGQVTQHADTVSTIAIELPTL